MPIVRKSSFKCKGAGNLKSVKCFIILVFTMLTSRIRWNSAFVVLVDYNILL